MMRHTLVAVFYFFLWVGAYAQKNQQLDLDIAMDSVERYETIMGTVSMMGPGISYSRATGYRDVASGAINSLNTQYRIGSISKVYTSVLVMKMVEQKKLSLATKLSMYFPQVENSEKITIEMMLRHRSGIRNYTDSAFTDWNTETLTHKQLLDLIVSGGSELPPDSAYSYSNSNYTLLYFILEEISRMSYADLLREYITAPLGLDRTEEYSKVDVKDEQAHSYSYRDHAWQLSSETDPSIPLGAGNLMSTAREVAVFLQALFSGKLVEPSSLASMMQFRDYYGLGLVEVSFKDKVAYGHTGGIDDFRSQAFYFPGDSLVICVLSNGERRNINNVSLVLLKELYEDTLDMSLIRVMDLSPPEQLFKKYEGVYLNQASGMKITVTKLKGKYYAQATGQSMFPLTESGADEFVFEPASIKMTFDTDKFRFLLDQKGIQLEFVKIKNAPR